MLRIKNQRYEMQNIYWKLFFIEVGFGE